MLNIEDRDPGIVGKQGTTGQYSQSYSFLPTQLALFTEAFFTPLFFLSISAVTELYHLNKGYQDSPLALLYLNSLLYVVIR